MGVSARLPTLSHRGRSVEAGRKRRERGLARTQRRREVGCQPCHLLDKRDVLRSQISGAVEMHVAWEDEQMHGRLRIQVIGNNKISRLQENVALCLRLWILGESGERVQSRGDGWFWRLREGRQHHRSPVVVVTISSSR